MSKRRSTLATVLLAGSLLATGVQGQTTWYVDDDAPLGGDGTSWDTAYKYLQDALADAVERDEIRAADGEARPGAVAVALNLEVRATRFACKPPSPHLVKTI